MTPAAGCGGSGDMGSTKPCTMQEEAKRGNAEGLQS